MEGIRMNDEKRLAVLEYNHKAGWIGKDKYEEIKAQILRDMKK
jgi:hypothetical protein